MTVLAAFLGPSQTVVSTNLFPWAPNGDFAGHWQEGLFLASLGGLGALVTLYFFAGGFLPSMGGSAEWEAKKLDLDALKEMRDAEYELWRQATNSGKPPEVTQAHHALCQALDARVIEDSRSLDRERWRLILMGSFLYVILGAAFAAVAADSYIQAILLGFGWTAVAERLGLRQKATVKNQAVAEALKAEQAKTAAAVRERDQYIANAKALTELLVSNAVPQTPASGQARQPKTAPPDPPTTPNAFSGDQAARDRHVEPEGRQGSGGNGPQGGH